MAVTRVLAKRGTAAQIEAVSAADQLAGEIAFATDTKEFYVSDGTQFNKITDLESDGNFYVDGNVGIGTTSPTSKLHVLGDGQGAGILLSSVDGYNVGRIYNNNSNAFPVGNLTLSYGSTTPAFINAESNGISIRGGATDTAGNNIKFRLYTSEQMRLTPTGLGIGTTSPTAKLEVIHTSASLDTLKVGRSDNLSYWRVNHAGNDFRLFNEDASGADILLGVDSGGNIENNKVGIGTATPSRKLHIYEPLINEPLLIESGDAGAYIEAKDSDTTSAPLFGARGNNFVVRTNGNESMRIDPSGNVGIGNTSPTAKLQVNAGTSNGGSIVASLGSNLSLIHI